MAFDPSTAQLAPDDALMSSGDDEGRQKQSAFERNRGWTRLGPRQFTTSLQPDEEAKFQAWVKESKAPFDPGQQADFDMRGFWKTSQDPAEWKRLQQAGKIPADMEPAGTKIDPNDGKPHFPDYWKTPYHETFSNESQWATEKAPKWNEKDQLVTPDGKVLFDDKAQNKPAEPAKSKFDPSTAKLYEPEEKPKQVPFDPGSAVEHRPDEAEQKPGLLRRAADALESGLKTIGDLPADYARFQIDAAKQVAKAQSEDLSTWYADKPGYTYGEVLPFRKNDKTGEVEWGYSPESARAIMRAAGHTFDFDINNPEHRSDVTALALGLSGLHRAPGGLGSATRPGAAPRAEPGFGEPPAGPTPTPDAPFGAQHPALTGPPGEPPPAAPPGAPLQIAGPGEPAPLAPGEPPAPTAPTGGLPEAKAKIQQGVTLAQRYAAEIQQLRTQGATPEILAPAIQRNREHLQQLQSYAEQVRDMEKAGAPGTAPVAAEPDWYRSYLEGIRSLVPADANPWAPVAEAPTEQPQAETPIAAPAPTEAAPAAAPATEAPAPVAPQAPQAPSVGTFQDMRTAGYDKNPDHPLAGRIEHLKELAQSPDLLPREQRELERRVRHFEQFNQLVADLPVEQRAMARSLRPDDIIQGKDKDGRTIVGRVEGFDRTGIMSVQDANGLDHQVHVSTLEDVQHVNRSGQPAPIAVPADEKRDEVPSPEAPSPESAPAVATKPAAETAYGGPWTRVKTKAGEDAGNQQGEPLYENPNGVRATFDNGVPHTESVIEHPEKGLIPRNAVDRRGQFLTVEETGLGAAPPKPKSESLPKTGGEAGKSKPKTAEKPDTESGGSSEWKYLADNEEGDPIYTNDQGVHSIVKDGVRIVEKVRLRPTKAGMAMSVPPPMEKEPAFRPALAPKSESESKPTQKGVESESPTAEAHTDSTPAAAQPTQEPLDPAHEEWWDKNLTPYGRRQVMNKASVNKPDKVLWRHLTYDEKAKLIAHKNAAIENVEPQASTPAEKPSIEAAKPEVPTPRSVPEGFDPDAIKAMRERYPNAKDPTLDKRGKREGAKEPLAFLFGWDLAKAGKPRPHPMSTVGTYTGWSAFHNQETPHVAEAPKPPTADLKGIPKIAYRGTGRADVASAYNGVAEPIAGPGRYSAFSKADAEKFGPNVEEAPIDLKNPLVIRSDDQWRALTKEAGWEFPNPFGMSADKMKAAAAKLKEVVQGKGHDGIIAWWNNDTPYDVDDQNRSIKALRNALGVPQVIDYREPKAEPATSPEAPPASTEPQTVTHVTKKGKTLTGTIRKDLDLAGAKALDPYAFKKDGGYFIRSKPDEALKPSAPAKPRPGQVTNDMLAEYFTPGETVRGYGGTKDKVVAFHPADDSGRWAVEVQEIGRDGTLGRLRNHMTTPTIREIEQARRERAATKPPAEAPPPAKWWEDMPRDARKRLLERALGSGYDPALESLSWSGLSGDTQRRLRTTAQEIVGIRKPTQAPAASAEAPKTKEPTDKIGPSTREISDWEIARAKDLLDDRDEDDQVDRVLDLLSKGWNPVEISEEPGINLTPREIAALDIAEIQDAEERELPPPKRPTAKGQGDLLKPIPSSLDVAEQQAKKNQANADPEAYQPPGSRDFYQQFTGWRDTHGPDGAMARVVAQALEDRIRQDGGDKTIRTNDLQSVADNIYGGKLADNAYSRDRLYDAIESGVNLFIVRNPERFAPTGDLARAQEQAAQLAEIKSWLPTQTVRAGDKVKLQQFSTPPDYAFAVNWAANIQPGEVVIEPSAGTGGIAVHAMNAGAQVIGNEISPQRRAMMETLPFRRITKENAEQLHNILPRDIKPTVVVMNPPFSSAGDRMGGKMVIETGAVHIEQALKRLEPGGRLVAIVGDGMKPEGAETAGKKGRNNATGATFRDWWKKIGAEYDVRANIGVGGEIYRKYGTTFPTRLLVIDKVAPSGEPPVVTTVTTSAELLDALQGVRDARPGSAREPVADQPGGAGVAQQGQGVSGSGASVRPPTGDVGVGGGQNLPANADSPKPANAGGGKTGGVRTGAGPRPSGGVRGNAPTVQQPGPDTQGVAGQSGEQPVPGDVSGGSGAGGDTSHLRPDGSDLSVTPPAPELLETSIIVPEEQTGGELTESVYENYRPQRITIEGAQPHPGPLVQSAAMASVLPPAVTYKTALPRKLITEGAVSAAQLEAIIYAGNAHSQVLEKDKDGVVKRRGFFIGDGTGVGKGREVAGIILDNKWQGRKKALWVSEKMQLANDAKRDWAGLGQNPNEILVHGKIKAGDEIKHDGILFTTYPTVASGEKFAPVTDFAEGTPVKVKGGGAGKLSNRDNDKNSWWVKLDDGTRVSVPLKDIASADTSAKTRVQQIVDWLGKDFDGVIAFDEAHNMANVTGGTGTRGKKEAAQKALAGLELQNALPNARVVYVSATGATEVSNLAYADRLGLWGPGTAFANRNDFLSRVSSGGVAAMELVARDMKALGYYTARSLSYDGVEYDRVQHDLTPPQRVMYDKIADAWQLVLRNMMEALAETGADGKGGPKSAILSAFWGGHQRFFNQLITSLQMPSVIEGIDKDLAEGRQAVLQLVNTNEAGQERALDKSKARGDEDLEELDMSPRDQLLQLVDKAFPIWQYETYVDPDGNERVRLVLDSEGNKVANPEAVAAKEKLLLDLGSLRVPDGPLEILVNHYGPEAVAEVTGRKQRVVNKPDETGRMKKVLEKRGADANVAEANSFQSGKKKILIFSQAGGTGRSYHDDKTADRVDDADRLGIGGNSGARRSHYLVQAGWRADTAVQGFGRTHRTNQWTAPIFHLVTTDLEGQKRFISSIARRLGQLGALTKGERRTGDQGMFGLQDNLESDEAKAGLVQLFRDIHGGRVEGFTTADLAEQMGLYIEGPGGELKDELPPMTQFLNRVLSLKVDDQNRVFNEFATRFRDIVDRAAAAGTLDAGTETYKADKIIKASDQVVYTDPNSGAETRHVHLVTSTRNYPTSFNDLMSGQSPRSGWNAPEFFVQNKRSGYISAVTPTTFTKVEPNGMVTEHYRVSTPLDWQYVPKDELDDSLRADGNRTRITNQKEAKTLWDDRVAKTPEFKDADLHIITGAILPIWDRLAGQPKIFRLQTDAGERMLGRVVDNKVINQTLERLGAEGVKLNVKPADVVEKILDGGVANLANGWTIKRRRVAQEYRLELTGTDLYSHTAELEAAGVFRERIPGSYDTRYFIPTGEKGAGTIEAITKRRPIISLEGD